MSSTSASEDFTRTGQRYDFILDNATNRSLSDARRLLAPTGMLVPNGGGFDNRWFASAGRLLRATVSFRFSSQRLGRFLVAQKVEDLVTLKDLIEVGKLHARHRPDVLAERQRAGDGRMGDGHPRGKIVISVASA